MFKDFISTPKPNGYRSLHTTVLGPENQRIEIQIRTEEMHREADLGVAAHWAYKEGGKKVNVKELKQYRWLRGISEGRPDLQVLDPRGHHCGGLPRTRQAV